MEEIEARLCAIRAGLDGTSEVPIALTPEPSLAQVSFGSLALPELHASPRRIAFGAAALLAIGLGGLSLGRTIEAGQPVAHASAAPPAADPPAPPPASDQVVPRRLHGPPLSAAPRSRHRRKTAPAPVPVIAPPAAHPAPPAPVGRYDIIPVY